VRITVNGRPVDVHRGTSVAVAVYLAGETMFRQSVSGEPRAPLCGMGVCQECRVRVDGVPHVKSCQVICDDGMKIETGG
jgi:aerobic-type carbon monoxide dehydrogenase small subunit (CoxS/CutS family)